MTDLFDEILHLLFHFAQLLGVVSELVFEEVGFLYNFLPCLTQFQGLAIPHYILLLTLYKLIS